MSFAMRIVTRSALRTPIPTRAFSVASIARAGMFFFFSKFPLTTSAPLACSRLDSKRLRASSGSPLTGLDIVTDLYIKNLKEFKPTPAKANDAEGQVKNWAVPAAPKAPEAASNVESELSRYESAEVESASASGTTSAGKDNDGDWFELDTSPDHAHH